MTQQFVSYYSSPIGMLQIRCTDTAVQAVTFHEEASGSADNHHSLLDQCRLQLDEYFEGRRKNFDLPLQQEGSVFQQKVWELLYAIPFGKTVSYQLLARQYGDPKAIRAVAAANGRNHLAIIIPCHRVIGSNRTLTGYAGGLWRKRWLLEHEARHELGVQEFSW